MNTLSKLKAEACDELATKLTNKGYRVYLSDKHNYGFFTDGLRCVYFDYDIFRGFSYCTCMKPSLKGGTGWGLDEHLEPEKCCTLLFQVGPILTVFFLMRNRS